MIPELVRIGPLTYRVREQTPPEWLTNRGEGSIAGEIGYEQQTIVLSKDLMPEYKELTLVHEIVHGVLLNIGGRELLCNEPFVERISTALYQLMRDNPDLCKMFLNRTTGEN